MSAEFYLNKLYPLQDEVLKVISGIPSKLYLTGGTALGRIYLQHRYSDNIDLFLNRDKDFETETRKVFDTLKENFTNVETPAQQENFARALVKRNDVSLKIKFVNDVGYHAGDFQKSPIYHKVDNPLNILSNKLSALTREAGKDLADLIYLSKNFEFNWEKMIDDGRKKDMWVNEVDVSQKIYEFPTENLKELNWIIQPDLGETAECQKIIAKEILLGADNSLYRRKQ